MSEQLLMLMEQAFSAMDEVCSGLAEQEWDLPTDLPGWSVKDNLSHICGIECRILGRPLPGGEPPQAPHVRNPVGAQNELDVESRRGRSGAQVLEEFRDLAGERLKGIAAMDADGWRQESWTPVGPGTVADLIAVRVLDVFYHEQDIRRGVGRPGHLNGDVARHAFARMSVALPMIVAKRAGAPDGTAVVFDVARPGRAVAVTVAGTRGALAEEIPADPAARLGMDLETFLCLSGGRWSPERALSEGRVSVEGDRELAAKVLAGINVMI